MSNIDWGRVFLPETPVLEILVRGTVTYLALFALLRLILKRQPGTLGLSDLLVIVLIADAAQNAMSGEYRSIADGLILVSTIIFWSFALDWLGYRFPRLQAWIRPPPLRLIENGRLLRHNMRKELIAPEELMSFLRQQGFDSASEIKEAYMEGDGKISLIPFDKEKESRPNPKSKERDVF